MVQTQKMSFARKWTTYLKSEQMFRFRSVAVVMVMMFVYGMLLLMIGYTSTDLEHITGIGNRGILLALPQSIGLIVGTLCMNLLLRKFNIGRILTVGYAVAVVTLVLISQLDHLAGIKTGQTITKTQQHKALSAYVVLNFIFGLGISLTSPIANTFISTIFQGKRRALFLGLINGIYGVGAGIIPLAASNTIYNLGKGTDFGNVRYFYYIAIAFAGLAFLMTFLLDYKHEEETLTTKDMDTAASATGAQAKHKTSAGMPRKLFIGIVMMVIALFSVYLMTETMANYGAKPFITGSNPTKHVQIVATMAVGMFFLVQGLWRMTSGFTLAKWCRFRHFILGSAVFVIAGYVLVASGAIQKNVNLAYVLAILFALGVGNLWGVLYAYASGINNKKAAFLGVVINITAMTAIPVTQAYSGAIIGLNKGALILGIVGICTATLTVAVMYAISFYLKKTGYKHPDDSGVYPFRALLAAKNKRTTKVKKVVKQTTTK